MQAQAEGKRLYVQYNTGTNIVLIVLMVRIH